MELSSQQTQTLSYFDRVSAEWRQKAEGKVPRVNIIAQRNACVHRIREAHPEVQSILDIGCGTGELVLEMASKGLRATGIDFAPEMIRACEQKGEAIGAQNANFVCSSIFEYAARSGSEDLISALGFIEYVSQEQLVELLRFCHRVLQGGGFLVLGSRNRIFNLFSLNEYTKMEMSLGTVEELMREAIALATAEDVEAFFAATDSQRRLPQPATHFQTGIDVSVRYQYTPGGLAAIMRDAGFEPIAVYPVHYHPMPPSAAAKIQEAHISFSNFVFETAAEDLGLIPSSSSFVIAARKK